MSQKLVLPGRFSGRARQSLRNVFIHMPTLIWVEKGAKQLWWQEQTLTLTASHWLLVPAGTSLTFSNEPSAGQFTSRTLGLLSPPEMAAGDHADIASAPPILAVDGTLSWYFDTLYQMPTLCHSAQQHLLQGFYAQLRHHGALGGLFPADSESLVDKLSRYFAAEPGRDYQLEQVCRTFHMSRATMTRKLAAQQTGFRPLLTRIRMMHALSLLQQDYSALDTALACGYQSEARFSARFRQMFGLTPKQYRQTL